MPRFGFETLYAPPQLDHCVSWEGRQFVAHFANQWSLDHSDFCFSFLKYDMVTHADPDSPEHFHSMLAHFLRCVNPWHQLCNL